MRSLFQMVGEFHRRFGLAVTDGRSPEMLDGHVLDFRRGFMEEELREFVEATSVAERADALVDLVYIALGTAHLMGVPFDEVFEEVQRANMAKARARSASESKRGSTLDVVKPPGWTPPDVAGVIRRWSEGLRGDRLCRRDRRYADLAEHVAGWSKDPSTKVGAVIVGVDPREVALGYNGFPPGIDDSEERLGDRETRLRMTQHAERNALDNSRFDVRRGTLYVTFFPCSECAKSVVSRGISRVVCPPPSDRQPWSDDARWTSEVLSEAGVSVASSRDGLDLLSRGGGDAEA